MSKAFLSPYCPACHKAIFAANSKQPACHCPAGKEAIKKWLAEQQAKMEGMTNPGDAIVEDSTNV